MNKLMDQLPDFIRGNRFYKQPYIDEFGASDSGESREFLEKVYGIKDEPEETAIQQANLISSKIRDSEFHMPIFDFDFPVVTIPSSTKGHNHTMLGQAMAPGNLEKLLKVMVEVGLIQQGVYDNQWKKRKALFVRLPWVKKGENKMPEDMKKKLADAYYSSPAEEGKIDVEPFGSPVKAFVSPKATDTVVLELALAYMNTLKMSTADALATAKKFVEKNPPPQTKDDDVLVKVDPNDDLW